LMAGAPASEMSPMIFPCWRCFRIIGMHLDSSGAEQEINWMGFKSSAIEANNLRLCRLFSVKITEQSFKACAALGDMSPKFPMGVAIIFSKPAMDCLFSFLG